LELKLGYFISSYFGLHLKKKVQANYDSGNECLCGLLEDLILGRPNFGV